MKFEIRNLKLETWKMENGKWKLGSGEGKGFRVQEERVIERKDRKERRVVSRFSRVSQFLNLLMNQTSQPNSSSFVSIRGSIKIRIRIDKARDKVFS